MSGGSFNYFYNQLESLQEAVEKMNWEDGSSLRYELQKTGLGEAVFEEWQKAEVIVNERKAAEERMLHRLQYIFKAFEWWQSFDTHEARFKEQLEVFKDACAKDLDLEPY